MNRCTKCLRPLNSFITTAYGEDCCEFCYDDYLTTDRGKVEYFIGLAKGELDLKDYDADFLGHVVVCWDKYRDELNITMREIREIEAKARMLGIYE